LGRSTSSNVLAICAVMLSWILQALGVDFDKPRQLRDADDAGLLGR